MTNFTIRYTEIAQQSIEDQIKYLADYHGLQAAFHRIDAIIEVISNNLASTPYGYPISLQSSELGVMQYRELNTDGYRVFYEVHETDQVIAVNLLLRDRQSVERALVRYCLLRAF
jgi:plasmid stabilization system protein ParE